MNKAIIADLLIEHLGPIPPLDDEKEDELIRRIITIKYPNGINIVAALKDLNISDRQRKPYQDALIIGRINDLAGEHLARYIKENVTVYPGADVEVVV